MIKNKQHHIPSMYTVEHTNLKAVKKFINTLHYSHKTKGLKAKHCFGLYREGVFTPDLIGAIIYALPAMPKPAQKYCPTNPDKLLELVRLVCIDDTLKNTESYFIGSTLRWLKKYTDYKVVLSYADPMFGHSGTIYKATNFIHSGMTGSKRTVIVDGKRFHERILTDKHKFAKEVQDRFNNNDTDIKIIKTKPKHIYLYNLR
jgi:hypothetical protein